MKIHLLSFYSTYEELKLSIRLPDSAVLISFYSTYEELKPAFERQQQRLREGFYSTYEELKHVEFECQPFAFGEFLQYLWGIETAGPVFMLDLFLWFLQYLWGIET